MPKPSVEDSGPEPDPQGADVDRPAPPPVDESRAGPGENVPAAGSETSSGEVREDSPPPALHPQDIYALAYTAGYRLGMPEDPMIEALIEFHRNLGSYLTDPERETFEALGEFVGQWWVAFGLGWADRRTGKDPDPIERGKARGG